MQRKYTQFAKNKCGLCFFSELNTKIVTDLNFVEFAIPEYFDINPNYLIKKNKEYILFVQSDIYLKYLSKMQNNISF